MAAIDFPAMIFLLAIPVVYLGFGFLITRFVPSRVRDLPFAWLAATVLLLPLAVSVLGVFVPVSHWTVFAFSAFCVTAGIAVERMRLRPSGKARLEEKHVMRPWELCGYVALLVAFVVALAIPKTTLLRSVSPTILDDVNNIHKTLSVAFDVHHPRYYHQPSLRLNYYYYDFVLPGSVFRLTPLDAQQSWFLHNILEYVSFCSLLLYAAWTLFQRAVARTFFLASWTFVGGLDSFMYLLSGIPVPGHVEWWVNDSTIPHDFSGQISSMYTLFLWVPQHLIAGMLFLLVLIAASYKPSREQRFVIVCLFAAIFGFSAFVFLVAAFCYVAAELILLHRKPWPSGLWRALPLHVGVFALLIAPMLFLYLSRGDSLLFLDPKVFGLYAYSVDALPAFARDLAAFSGDALNALLSVAFILGVELGVVALLAVLGMASSARKGESRLLPGMQSYATAVFLVSWIPLFFVSSVNYNDFYMRGAIVMQVAALVLAALFLERQRRWTVPTALALLLLLPAHLANVHIEFVTRSNYAVDEIEGVHRFLREHTPKDAVVFTDTGLCGDITYRGNRVCAVNMDQVDPQYAVRDAGDARDYADPSTGLATPFPNRYFLSRTARTEPYLLERYVDADFRVYQFVPGPWR